MKELGIYGAGGLGKDVYELAKQINMCQKRWHHISFIVDKEYLDKSDNTKTFEEFVNEQRYDGVEIAIAIGEPIFREKLYKKIKKIGTELATLVHPNVYIPDSVQIGEGVIIFANSIVSPNAQIGRNVLMQYMSYVGHDSQIGENTVVAASALIAGKCKIGDTCYIGLGSNIKEEVVIGHNSIVGMSAVVLKNVSAKKIVIGNPARVWSDNDEGIVFKQNRQN